MEPSAGAHIYNPNRREVEVKDARRPWQAAFRGGRRVELVSSGEIDSKMVFT